MAADPRRPFALTEIGLLLAVPSVVSLVVEPALGVASVTWRRRVLVLGGGLAFAAALMLAAVAPSFWVLLAAFALLYPASGAFVSLSQASLMDLQPERRQHNMARWTLAGAVGAVLGPLLLAGFAFAGLDGACSSPASPSWRSRSSLRPAAFRTTATTASVCASGEALRAITRREVFRWLFLLEALDLLGDVFLGFLALYFVDDVGRRLQPEASRSRSGPARDSPERPR